MRDLISVVIPVYNEQKYIKKCVESLLKQDYPLKKMEWIFVDGMSSDDTKNTLIKFQNEYPDLIKIFDNPNMTVPYAMNIGIKNSKGRYIIRLDAHAEYNNDYIRKCVYYLDNTDADNVGGVAQTKSHGLTGESIALMLSSKFGVGNSSFRTFGSSGYVDTVPFGAFRREVFEKWGGYDERLTRNQDNEMNWRIRKNGGKIYMADDIKFSYYCRDSVRGIVDMAVKNGMWNVITMKLCAGSMGIRHFVPLAFLLSLIILLALSAISRVFAYILIVELMVYLISDVAFSIKATREIKHICMLLMLFPVFHLTYGFGSLKGLIRIAYKKYK